MASSQRNKSWAILVKSATEADSPITQSKLDLAPEKQC